MRRIIEFFRTLRERVVGKTHVLFGFHVILEEGPTITGSLARTFKTSPSKLELIEVIKGAIKKPTKDVAITSYYEFNNRKNYKKYLQK